ncbi:MAG: glycosyltransferase family 4 protein [Anaerolineae bacterium]|nr:glycosyltransferase family 4 protein [Anaerolineae bacterium]
MAALSGAVGGRKNVDRLIDQFAIAADVAPDLHLMLVGDGLNREMLEVQVRQLELQERIHFTGTVPITEVPNYMAAADIFTTASVSEVHPLTVIEAMATGCPVVAISSPGIIDCVDSGRTGLLTTRPDGGLAAAMVGLALNPTQRAEMSVAARADSNRYDINHTISRTLELYERLHSERPDLKRKQPHGRRFLYRQRMRSTLDRIFKQEENEHPLLNWFTPDYWLRDRKDSHDEWK